MLLMTSTHLINGEDKGINSLISFNKLLIRLNKPWNNTDALCLLSWRCQSQECRKLPPRNKLIDYAINCVFNEPKALDNEVRNSGILYKIMADVLFWFIGPVICLTATSEIFWNRDCYLPNYETNKCMDDTFINWQQKLLCDHWIGRIQVKTWPYLCF